MKVEDLIVYGKSHCHSDHVKLLLADLLNLNPLELLNHLNDEVSIETANKFKKEIISLKDGKPLQYVIGNVNFYGNKFKINEDVLIPRYETEELVENTIKYIKQIFKNKNEIHILDIGCGSGVIGLTLKDKIPNAKVDLLDISASAINVAKENARLLNLDVSFINSDVFENVFDKYDVIISNPPYIKNNEEIDEIVKNNEPSLALYGGDDGLDIYRKITKDINKYLNPTYIVAFEIGYMQKEAVEHLLKQNLNPKYVEAKKDLSKRDRMVFAINNE